MLTTIRNNVDMKWETFKFYVQSFDFEKQLIFNHTTLLCI